jgi:hypothetical protein
VILASSYTEGVSFHKGYLAGKQWTPVELAGLGYDAGWKHVLELTEFVAVCLSESAGREKAHCFNYKDSRLTDLYAEDIGLMQISRDTKKPVAPDDPLWDAVKNVHAARDLFKRRGWQPWHGYTNFVATNPAMAGEYIQRAVWGVGNFQRKTYGVPQIPYPRSGTALRELLDRLTHNEHPLVPAFRSRTTGVRPKLLLS